MSNTVLDGIRVLDLGDFASGPYCTRVLADLGAEVIKVEPPTGDSARRYGPFPGDVEDPERSGLFLWLNYGKQSVTIDRDTAEGRMQLEVLLADSDVAVLSVDLEGRAPAVEELRALSDRHPQLILVAITPFGIEGKYASWAGYDINIAAMSGLTYGSEESGREPLVPPALQMQILSGLGAAYTTMAALMSRGPGGPGQIVDFSQTQFMTTNSAQSVPTKQARPPASGADAPLAARTSSPRARPHYPAHVLHCADGRAFLYAPQIRQWVRFVEAMGEPEWTKDPKFRNRLAMANEYREETDALVEDWMRRHTKDDLLQTFMQYRVPGAPILDTRDMVESKHLAERAFFLDLDYPAAGAMKLPGFQFRMSATPLRAADPAPLLGQHNERLHQPSEPQRIRASSADRPTPTPTPTSLPLAGCRIVDFGTVMVGGAASRLLVELGAEVIKVESHVSPDGYRIGAPNLGSEEERADRALWPELQAGFHSLHRNKLGITVNMKELEGLDLLKQLIATADVVTNNFSPRVLERRGLDYESLKAIKPDIILASMPGAGETGPLSNYATYAWTVEALVGMTSINGYPDGELVGHLAMPWGDVVNAFSGALGVLAAVQHRRNTGEGQYVESAQLEAFAALMGEPYLDYILNARIAQPRGNRSPLMAPHQCYRVAEGRWVAIAVRTEDEWHGLCRATGNTAWAVDPRFATLAERQAHIDELDALVADWAGTRSSDEVVSLLQGHEVAATPVLDLDDQVADRYFYERGAFIEVEHPLVGKILVPGLVARLAIEEQPTRPSPRLGEHNDYVFGDILGVPEDERRRLVEARVIY